MAINNGYEIQRAVCFDNSRDFALSYDPAVPNTYVTWQFTEGNGMQDYYWGNYFYGNDKVAMDYNNRIFDCKRQYGVQCAETQSPDFYKYYSTQQPVAIAIYPRSKDNLTVGIPNYRERHPVENDSFRGWGELLQLDPLTKREYSDYELQARVGQPDRGKPSIPAQLSEDANRAVKENAIRPVPEKKAEKDRR